MQDVNEPKTMLEINHDRLLKTFEEAINENISLKEEKERIIEVFDEIVYNAMLHDIPIAFDKIIEKIKTIQFSIGNRYLLKEAYQYDNSKNRVELKEKEMGENDIYYLTSILYELALHPDEKENSYFEALYKGQIYDLSISTLGIKDIPVNDFDEVILYRSMKAIFKEDVIANALLTKDCSLLYQTMQDYGFTKEDIQLIRNTSNYNQYGRYPAGNSSLLDVEMRIIDVFVENASKEPITQQQMHFFKKTLDTAFKQEKDTTLKYGIKDFDTIKKYVGNFDLSNTSNFSVLSEYLNQKSNSYGLNEIEYGKAK